MKRSELFFGAILVPLDYVALLAAGAGAYYLRTSALIERYRPAIFELDLPFFEYMQLVAVVSALSIGIFALQGLYVMQVTRRPLGEFWRIFVSISIGLLVIAVYAFFTAELFQSRFIVLAAYLLALIFVALARHGIRQVQVGLLERGMGVHRVVLVGNGRYGNQLQHILEQRPHLGYRVVGHLEVVRWDQLEELYQQFGIDEMIQTDPTMPEDDYLILLDFCEKYKIDFKYIPNLFETYAAHVRYRQLGGVPIVELMRTPLEGWGRVVKRAVDIVGATIGIILFAPLLLAVALAIKHNSPGPILYKQTRIGRHKQPFNVYKFRSMYAQYCIGDKYGGQTAEEFLRKLRQTNERKGPLFKMRNDPRITKVGRFIRRWRIDELPQFINVLRSEMSLIGPRPHLPDEVRHYDKHHQILFAIKPGMSGMAQVNGSAGLSFEQEANLDISYIEGWSLRHDIILLVKTFLILITDRNAV